MRLTRQHQRSGAPELNIASMIDVVFLLLIFFMCTSTFDKMDETISAALPTSSREPQKMKDFDPIQIRIRKSGDGTLVLIDNSPCSDFEALAAQLKARRAIADVPVIIQGDHEVPFEYMVAALDACYRAQFTKAAFSARGIGAWND